MPTPEVAYRTLRSKLSCHKWDLLLTAAGVLLLSPTCWYRYGIDQALYHYVGAGWLEGRLPYRDAFDIKSPGVYAVYAIAIATFGASQASIRVAEILCVVATGWLAATTVERRERVDGLAGVLVLLLAAWQAFLFGFWDTGQAELWEGSALVVVFALLSRRRTPARVFFAGALAGVSAIVKVPALLSVCVLAAVVVFDDPEGRKRGTRSLPMFVLGTAFPVFATTAYFAARGALPALLQWTGYVRHYAAAPLDIGWVRTLGPELALVRCSSMLVILLPLSIARYPRRNRGRFDFWPELLLLSAVIGIVWQRRYFSYHPSVLGPLLVLNAARGANVLLSSSVPSTLTATIVGVSAAFFSSPEWTGHEDLDYRKYVFHAFLPFVTNQTDRSSFDATFDGPFNYSYAAHEKLAELIAERRPRAGDGLHVRGYDTTVYVLTNLYSPSRFMMESPLGDPYLRSYAPQWVAEHDEVLFRQHKPRFFVTNVGAQGDLANLREEGYGTAGSRDRYVLMELGLSDAPLNRSESIAAVADRILEGKILGSVRFNARLQADGTFTITSLNNATGGSWYANERSELCVRPETSSNATCATLVRRDGDYLALSADGRELARFVSMARSP